MTHSPLTSYVRFSPNYSSRGGQRISKITPHHMAGNLTVETCGNVFSTTDREASANYGIGSDGRIACYVEEEYRAWTSASYSNDAQAVTIEVANSYCGGDWPVSDAAWESLIALCVDICQRNGISGLSWTGDASGSLTCHYMFAPTACPGPYLKSRMGLLADEVNKRLNNGYTPSVKPTSKPTEPAATGSIEDLARRTIAGEFGNGEARRSALGSNYDAVQARVNQMLGLGGTAAPSTSQTPNIEALARDVLAGKYGNGEARRAALGSNYDAVQARVNELCGVSNPSGSTGKYIDDLAREVIAGKWGNGNERRNRLTTAGYDYDAIQNRVNQML